MIDPLTPPDCDLTDFAFMPLDVARLRDSELASSETPEACWAAVLLWAASWHQVPAASIPNDDKWMAQASGYGRVVKEWLRIKTGALRGWVECSDGRLYHPVVAEKAREAWQAKLEQRWRTECARIKKHNDRHEADIPKPTFDEWLSLGCPSGQPLPVPRDKPQKQGDKGGDKPSKRQGEGQGQGDSSSEAIASAAFAAMTPEQAAALTREELWSAGKSILEAAKVPKAQCGSFIGKLVKDYTPEVVVDVVRAAVVEIPADPREWMTAACQSRVGQRKPVNRQEAIEARNRAVGDEWLKQQEALDACH